MHLSHIEAQLDYEVAAPAHMLLNIEAARSGMQSVIGEELVVEPPTPLRLFCDEGSGNRFVRFDASQRARRLCAAAPSGKCS